MSPGPRKARPQSIDAVTKRLHDGAYLFSSGHYEKRFDLMY